MFSLHVTPWMAGYFVSGLLGALLTTLVNARGRGPLRTQLALLLGGVTAILFTTGSVFAAADEPTATLAVRFSQAAAVWLPFFGVRFAGALARRPLAVLSRFTLVTAPIASALALGTPFVIAGARHYRYGYAGVPGPLYPIVLVEMLTLNALPVVLFEALRHEERPLERRQLANVLAASGIGMFAFVDVLPILGFDAAPVGWIPLVGAAGGLLFAIVRHRFLDIRMALRRALWWLFSTALAAVGLSLIVWPLATLSGGRRVPLALVVAATLLLMRLWLGLGQARLDRLVGRRKRDLDAEMAHLTDSAATLQTTEELGRAVDRFLVGIDRRLAALVVIDPSGRPRVTASAWGSVPAPARASPLLGELFEARTLVWRDQVRATSRVEIERACVRWGAEYLGPLIDGEELLGIVAIAPKVGGGLADALELEALDRMCITVTAALASARLYERLRTLHDELEMKAQARQVSLGKALRDLRGAEQRLVQSEKMAALGQIVGGVAADLADQVRGVHSSVAEVRAHTETVARAVNDRLDREPALADDELRDMTRDLRPLLDAVGEGGRRALAIASDLSRFAPTDDGDGVTRERAPARLEELVDATLKLCAGHLRQIEVIRKYDSGLPAVAVETGPLGQVVLNLVLNAVQAMFGKGTLTLSTRHCGGDGGAPCAELAVSDTGPGIEPEVLPRIFEPFFSTKGHTLGTGLGLSVSYGIVERHGGRIHVESTLGVGTTFRVQLPLV
ncbi:MAG: response regulator receiver sensor signal transduction histidine kinase [Myxococcales bacterium]|nr:response regulator receiver sensor signal transduction histidine kinase [Myxococcales bacterium]